MQNILKIENLKKYYGTKNNITKAIDNISFSVNEGEFVAIMGASGSGKTTLLNCISTIDTVTAVINTVKPTTEKLYDDIGKYVENTMTNNKDKSDFYVYNLSVKGDVISENRSILTIFSFILFYIAFIFTAIVATILAIQILSDSTKYKYHYSILSKLGVEQSQIYKTIRKQLLIFFLFPVIYPIIIDISVTTSLNNLLNPALSSEYSYLYAILYSLSLFLFIYLIYFVATYFGYKKNIEE